MGGSRESRTAVADGAMLSAMICHARCARDSDQLGLLLEQFRNYLKLIADAQINQRLKIRIDASDVVQETFLDAHQDFSRFRGQSESELIAWLRKILARNICDQAKRHRAQRRDVFREQSLEAAMHQSSIQLAGALGGDISTPSCRAIKREQAVLVADAIAELSEEQRQVILLRQMHRIPFEEIGNRLGKSSGAVRMIWLRALESLRKLTGKVN